MIWSISWKNIWRNRTRSLVVIFAVTIGLFGGIFSAAIMNGMTERRIRSAIKNEVSHIQLHNPNYLDNEEIDCYIENAGQLVDSLERMPEVKAVSKRIKVTAMANTSKTGTGVIVMGINPLKEKQVTGIFQAIPDSITLLQRRQIIDLTQIKQYLVDSCGSYFGEEKSKIPSIVIGQKLAEKLKVCVRKKIVISPQTMNGNLIGGNFKVVGIYKTSNSMFDETHVFVREEDLCALCDFDSNNAHEIAILLKDNKFTNKVLDQIKKTYTRYKITDEIIDRLSNELVDKDIISILRRNISNKEFTGVEFENKLETIAGDLLTPVIKSIIMSNAEWGINAMTWKEIQPDLGIMTDFVLMMLYVFMVIILLALGFGIVNTMLMVVLERVKELGMLMAVGMNKLRVFNMIMLETIFLSISGGVIGMIISWFVVQHFAQAGIHLPMFAEGLEAIGYEAILYPEIGFDFYLGVILLIILTGILASVYPARKALALNPVEALRTE